MYIEAMFLFYHDLENPLLRLLKMVVIKVFEHKNGRICYYMFSHQEDVDKNQNRISLIWTSQSFFLVTSRES